MASDEDIVAQLRKLLTTVDFQTTTERMIRQQLEKHFAENLSDRKQIIREEINDYLAKQQADDEDETGEVEADVKEEESGEEEEPEEDTGGTSLSEALQEFLGVTSMRRPMVVKALWAYIKGNDLQDPKNKKNIRLDDKLATLFSAPLNMLNMNKQLNKHVKGGAVRGKKPGAASKAKKAKKAKGDDDDAPKRPNNFSKPLKISTELAAFLGQGEASRGEITKKFWEYFKKNGLQDPADKRWILSDDKLKALLGSDRFQGFSLSKLVQRHIIN